MTEQKKVNTIDVNNLVITPTFLKNHHACKGMIRFFEINFAEGLDLSRVKVNGDYKWYFYFIERLFKSKFEYDENGVATKRILPNRDIWKWKREYNDHGDIIKETLSNGIIIKNQYEYDKEGNKIKKIFPDGYILEYNIHGDIVKRIFPDGTIKEWKYKYEYDEKGNKTKIIYPDGYIEEYIFKYDNKERLIQVEDCRFKYLDE